jgi:hypothetical protein
MTTIFMFYFIVRLKDLKISESLNHSIF